MSGDLLRELMTLVELLKEHNRLLSQRVDAVESELYKVRTALGLVISELREREEMKTGAGS